ncbi:hypothetical protein HPP92_013511 [Vanilla planifolia]|uniref:Uncharacterized protein n=1 Tax=Vanilla planifolia TaxID=51239 RepID=A0A835QUV6_VANPL|nr:hypothetical protein HPP92_013511 [Vanilla planifolia]
MVSKSPGKIWLKGWSIRAVYVDEAADLFDAALGKRVYFSLFLPISISVLCCVAVRERHTQLDLDGDDGICDVLYKNGKYILIFWYLLILGVELSSAVFSIGYN